MLRRLATLLLLVCVLLPAGTAPVAAQSAYDLVDLGSFISTGDAIAACADDFAGRAFALNAKGVVTGTTGWGERTGTAFRATDGEIKRLKGGQGGAGGRDINADGQVAGFVVDDLGEDPCSPAVQAGLIGARHAATWVGGELELLPDGGEFSEALAINDDGVVVGRAGGRPVAWRDGEAEALPLPADVNSGYAVDINAAGGTIGVVYGEDSTQASSVLWDDGEMTMLPDGFIAGAINDDGVIVGSTDEGTSAARLVDGELEPLPGVPDDARFVSVLGVNAGGAVLGYVAVDEPEWIPVLWRGEEMTDVATLFPVDAGYSRITPGDINGVGMLLLNAVSADGEPHGIVLVPEER